jgi:signal peptidase I
VTSYQVAAELAREGLATGSLIRLRVSSDSMAPLIEPGDMVLVRHVNPKDLRRGDLILVEQEGSFLIHRLVLSSRRRIEGLVAAEAHGLRTKGDNRSHADPPLTSWDVLGQVVSVEKEGRRIELGEGRWPMVNRLLGLLGWCEVGLFTVGRIIKQRLEACPEPSRRVGSWRLTSRAAMPFRWLTRLLIHVRVHR